MLIYINKKYNIEAQTNPNVKQIQFFVYERFVQIYFIIYSLQQISLVQMSNC